MIVFEFSENTNNRIKYIDSTDGNIQKSLMNQAFFDTFKLEKAYSFVSNCSVLTETPYGNDYLVKDFENINNILFPFIDSLEIYRWNDDFSYYFDDGKEWWGIGCWSVYDKTTHIYTIIAVSLTD